MDLHRLLVTNFATGHPGEAAAALERRPPDEVASVLSALSPDVAAGMLARMAPGTAARAADKMDAGDAAAICARLSVDATLSVLRRLAPARARAIIDALPRDVAGAVDAVIGFPPGTAGALMDPQLLAFPLDMTVADTIAAVQRDAAHAHYNVYVVDRDHALVGVLNLQELLHAPPKARLETVMKPAAHRLDVSAGRHAIINHPGWRHVYSLPVVDGRGRFVGAVRYRAMRRLEAELSGRDDAAESITVRALGDLFGAGLGGLVGAFASTVTQTPIGYHHVPPADQPAQREE